jgi:predicted MFS family arabinose efflux permease
VTAWIALGAGGTAVIATAHWMAQRGPRPAWILTTCTIAVAAASVAVVPTSTLLVLAACTAFGWGYTAASGALIAWTAEIDPPRAPAGTALLFITLILGQALGAGAVGALIPALGYPVTFLAAAVASAAAAVPALKSLKNSKIGASV